MTEMYNKAFWDARYSEKDSIWSGNPNPVLVSDVSGLAPGTALDVGCGEGADAIWLARRGWTVTGVDISTVALQRAAAFAAADSDVSDVASRLTWEQHDLAEWSPPEAAFDLVSAQFLHLTGAQSARLFPALAAAVAPGGTLLIVGHDFTGMNELHRQHMQDHILTIDMVEDVLDAARWTIEVSESRERAALTQTPGPDGSVMHLRDIVVRARRTA